MNKERFLILAGISILILDIFLIKIESEIYTDYAMGAYIFSGADALIVSPFYSYFISFLYFFSFIFLHPILIKFRGLFLATNLFLVLSAFTHGFSVSSPLFSVTGGLYFIIVGMLAGMGKR